jgi:hypothetical protein
METLQQEMHINSIKYFWPLMEDMSIRDAAVTTAEEVPGSGSTPIRFYDDRSYYGYAW